MTQLKGAIRILYTNHRGETRWRLIRPHSMSLTTSEWHPKVGEQYFLSADDVETGEWREFLMSDIHQWDFTPVEVRVVNSSQA
jgi:hypothetical protein